MKDLLPDITIRSARQADLADLQRLFAETILHSCRQDYSPEQLAAWAAGSQHEARWLHRLNTQFFLVAASGHQIVGFSSLDHGDYLDLMYVHPDFQRRGVANRLLRELEKESQRQGVCCLRTDVSKTARPFFEKNGFRLVQEQTQIIGGIAISNFKMEKFLATP